MSSPYEPPGTAAFESERPPANPWSPMAIGWISALLSFLPGGIMYALNYERLGMPERKKPALIGVIVGFAVFMVLAVLAPEDSPVSRLLKFMNIGVAYQLYRGQSGLFERHMKNGGAKASPWPAVGVSLGAIVAASALVGVAMYAAGLFEGSAVDAAADAER